MPGAAQCEKLPAGVDFTNSFIYDGTMYGRKMIAMLEGFESLSNDAPGGAG